MAELHDLYRINEENLALRRGFINLTSRDVAALKRLAGWADRHADGIAHDFYEHQFAFSETAHFFKRYAAEHGHSLSDLRANLEKAQAGYLRDVFAEAKGAGRFGTAYFERRLRVGRLHNLIDLPLKWYLGSYVTYFDLIRTSLWRTHPHRPRLCVRGERALVAVFNLDMQAIVEAFYYDTFATMGVDLSQIAVATPNLDLSDRGSELKSTVRTAIAAVARVTGELRLSSQEMAQTSEEAGRAVGEIAQAVTDVATGAERQVQMIDSARSLAQQVAAAVNDSAAAAGETAEAAERARMTADEGVTIAGEASEAMLAVRDAAERIAVAIRSLADKSDEIGAIVDTITGIADQTNLLALNAAIEAARAGEQGRGFAVVAEQVRKLAESSAEAAGQISSLIAEIQGETKRTVTIVEDGAQRTERGVETVAQARTAFEEIGGAVTDIATRIQEIASVAGGISDSATTMQENISEVAAVAEQSSASSEEVSASTQQSSAATEQIAASAQQLSRTADDLELLVGQFKIGDATD